MSDSSKARLGTPIKNPLLSASVTGLTFDDFPNKPQLLPAAPPIIHAPPPSITPTALLGREHKSLVTVGSSSVDTENLDEINLNASNEDSVSSGTSDANANPLLEQPNTSDSILSQAASSFSALPSVASNVFSSFSKRINAISSRETTPSNDQDPNGNFGVPQLDIQPTYTQQQQYQASPQPQVFQQLPPATGPFYAPPPPQAGGNYFGSLPPTSAGVEVSQHNVPPLEPPKFYTPGEVSTLPTNPAVPPAAAGGPNNFRLTAKKKLYAPIPGLSDQSQQPAAPSAFQPPSSSVSAPISFDNTYGGGYPSNDSQYGAPAYLSEERKSEERKTGGGLFSKITNLAPAGVLQNITGLVQSAAGTITQTIKPDSSAQISDQQQAGNFGVTFDQQQSGYFSAVPPPPAVNYFAAPPLGDQQPNYPPPPPATVDFSQSTPFQAAPAPPTAVSFFNPQATGASLPQSNLATAQATAPVNFFDSSKGPTVFDPSTQSTNTSEPSRPQRPSSRPGNSFSEAPHSVPLTTPPISTTSQQPSRPPSHPSRPPSQPGSSIAPPQLQPSGDQSSIPFFKPLQTNSGVQLNPVVQPAVTPTPPSQVGFFDPATYLTNTPVLPQSGVQPPVQPTAAPPSGSALPPPPGGQTSYRLQKGTKLYKNPLTAQETAPVQVTPNPSFAVPPATFTSTPFAANPNIAAQAPPPQAVYDPFGQRVTPSLITPVANIFVPNTEPQSVALFAPPTESSATEAVKTHEESVSLFANTTEENNSETVALFAAPIQETKTPSIPLFAAAAESETKAEELKTAPFINQPIEAAEVKKVEQPSSETEHFFKPIEPAVEQNLPPVDLNKTASSASFFGGNEESQQFFKPIEPVVEDTNISSETESQEIPLTSLEQNVIENTLEENVQKLSLSSTPVPTAAEPSQNVPQLPPSSLQAGLGSSNPYRRGSTTETTKPSAVQPTLANFFTPAASSGAGDFNFFSNLPSAESNIVQQSTTNFFSSPAIQPETSKQTQGDSQNFFNSQTNLAPEASSHTQAPNFFNPSNLTQSKPEIVSTLPLETTTRQATGTPSSFFDSTESSNKSEAFLGNTSTVPEQQQSVSSTPYPPEIPSQESTTPGTGLLPTLPANIGIIPSVSERSENITTHQTEDTNLPTHVPPPIGFESFMQNTQQPTAPLLPATTNTTTEQQNTTAVQHAQQPQQQPQIVSTFSNFFNQIPPGHQEIPKDPSSFFDSFAAQQPQPQTVKNSVSSGNSPPQVANEDQLIQNFFNNPPPKDADHAGDLNYDLVHSGLAIKNLQQRSLTPVSNLVEPPSSACSEFSTLNASETSIIKEDSKPDEPSTAVNSNSKHFEELPEEVLKELRMANLLQGDKAAATSPASGSYKPAVKHWFYKHTVDAKQVWTPFSHYDSALLETSLVMDGEDKPEIVAVEGGRYDVNISERLKRSVYWDSEPIEVRRCSWFYKAVDSKYIPYEESTADVLEGEYKQAAESGVWHKTIILGMGEQVVFYGPTVIVHFQQQHNQDAWGGTTQTTTRPRMVKRDLDDFNIAQGESQKVDHLLFMVHGIGSACDLKLRSVEEVVEDFRSIAHQLVLSHYKNSSDLGLVGRVEVLPISWHSHLHSIELGIDEKLRSITLESIPKLRNFTNDTLLDILFYTSPTFCQKIMNSIVMSLNDIYLKYRQRHPEFNGGVSLAGHSLGSLICFDLLCHQNPIKESEEKNLENPDQQFLTTSTAATMGQMQMDSNQLDSNQIGYTMGPAGTGQPFINYGQLIFQPKKFFALGSPIGMFVTIRGIDKLGLDFRLPTCPGFYNIFHPYDPVAYRIEALVNPDLSGARPVLIPHHKGRKRMHLELKETMARVSLDLKQRFLDKFKNTFDSVNIFGTSTKSKKEAEELMEKEVEKVIEMQMELERQSSQETQSQQNQENLSPSNEQNQNQQHHLPTPTTTAQALRTRTESVSTVVSDDMVEVDFPLGKLNDSKRIDYVLQEAPLEFINEYIFALSSHVCYWDSEDTILFVMKEIYSGLGISPDSQVPQQTMTIERPSSRNSFSTS